MLRTGARLLCTGVCMLIAFSSQAAPAEWGTAQLMQDLARRQANGGRAHFVETKYIALLDKPVVSSGELAFVPPDRLEKRTLLPKPELLTIDDDRLEIERRGKRYSMRLAERPEAIAFADSIRGALTGDQKKLEASYTLDVSGTRGNWGLRLVPSEARLAALVERIDIKGSDDLIHTIEYTLPDGDRTVMRIEPIEAE